MTNKKKIQKAKKQAQKMEEQRESIQDNLMRGSSFIEKYGVPLTTIIVATIICGYIALKIPEAFEMWNDDASSLNEFYVYGLIGCTGAIWLVYIISAIKKMLKNRS